MRWTLMRTNRDWQALVKGAIRAELARRNMSYRELADRLESIGVKGMNERTISNKVNRGTFSAVFFFQVMDAIGVQNIHLNGDDWQWIGVNLKDVAVAAMRDKGLDPDNDRVTRTDFVRRVTLQLNDLCRKGKVEKVGRGRTMRWKIL
jgi:3-mercaptopyruvate sulfurtransferase SseA